MKVTRNRSRRVARGKTDSLSAFSLYRGLSNFPLLAININSVGYTIRTECKATKRCRGRNYGQAVATVESVSMVHVVIIAGMLVRVGSFPRGEKEPAYLFPAPFLSLSFTLLLSFYYPLKRDTHNTIYRFSVLDVTTLSFVKGDIENDSACKRLR